VRRAVPTIIISLIFLALNGLDSLRELDLSCNFVTCVKNFKPFLSISTLQWLSLAGNPVCLIYNYRNKLIKNLHVSASFGSVSIIFYFHSKNVLRKEKCKTEIRNWFNFLLVVQTIFK